MLMSACSNASRQNYTCMQVEGTCSGKYGFVVAVTGVLEASQARATVGIPQLSEWTPPASPESPVGYPCLTHQPSCQRHLAWLTTCIYTCIYPAAADMLRPCRTDTPEPCRRARSGRAPALRSST